MVAATVSGAANVLAKVAGVRANVVQAAEASLYRWLLKVFAASDSIVPVKYGRLRSSAWVGLPTVSGTTVSIRAGYGASYAMPVHENLAAHHEHGQAKFLELAFQENVSGMKSWLAADIKDGLKSGRKLQTSTYATSPQDGG